MRVLVISDDVPARVELAARLSGQLGLAAVEGASLDAELIRAAGDYGPDVVVWDLGDKTDEGAADFSAMRDLDVPVIVLGDDGGLMAEAVAAGARGALFRGGDTAPLVAAVQAVREGLVVIDPAFAPAAVPARGGAPDIPADELTHREFEVLQLLAEGLPNKQIAQRLEISEHTVKFHVDAILGKLGAHSRTEAVTRAARMGLIVL